tara:strand:- start:167 stop:850 length:684 start_codon:yes stop_codon:yes gene_type:complete
MVHLIDSRNPVKNQIKLNTGQIREIAKAFSEMLAVTVAEIPEKVIALLKYYEIQIRDNATEKELITVVVEKVAKQDRDFNMHLEQLILIALPELKSISNYDNFGDLGALFGGGSGGNKLVQGATEVGTSTASGAAGGGIVGAALGAIGGIFSFATSTKQEKIEKEKASAMTFSSLMQYKSAKLNGKGSGQKTITIIVIAAIALVGVVATVMLIQKNKKATTWEMQGK